ncbi:hypothetical protein RB628_39345, partial [Streptomyces sp. ADMS]|nr:hypothetical protein [Streptomyces sp. ADMS]
PPTGHTIRINDPRSTGLGWALTWAAAATAAGWAVIIATSRVARPRRHAGPGSAVDQVAAGVRMGLRDGAQPRAVGAARRRTVILVRPGRLFKWRQRHRPRHQPLVRRAQ